MEITADAGLDGICLHDLRRDYMPTAAAMGVNMFVLRDLLGHRDSTVADLYIRSVGEGVRQAREEIGAKMAMMMDGQPDGEAEDG